MQNKYFALIFVSSCETMPGQHYDHTIIKYEAAVQAVIVSNTRCVQFEAKRHLIRCETICRHPKKVLQNKFQLTSLLPAEYLCAPKGAKLNSLKCHTHSIQNCERARWLSIQIYITRAHRTHVHANSHIGTKHLLPTGNRVNIENRADAIADADGSQLDANLH